MKNNKRFFLAVKVTNCTSALLRYGVKIDEVGLSENARNYWCDDVTAHSYYN